MASEKCSPDLLQNVTTGNAIIDGRAFNDWFVGDIQNWTEGRLEVDEVPGFGLRDNRSVEVKWGIHPEGEVRPTGWAPGSEKVTLSILLRGRFSLRFREPETRDQEWVHTLATEGDYAIWDEHLEHIWRAEEDSVILTVRWRQDQ